VNAEALVLTAPRRFERREIALPALGASDGLLRVEACGLCGTDHERRNRDLALTTERRDGNIIWRLRQEGCA